MLPLLTHIFPDGLNILDPTLALRWELEPRYPEVSLEDARGIANLQASLIKTGSHVHDLMGIRVSLDHELDPFIAYLVANNAYEFGDIALIREHVECMDRAMVWGAGMGVIGTALAQQTKAFVPLVDANEAVAAYVAKTATLNGVTLPFVHGAIVPGKAQGVVQFTVSAQFWASSLRDDTHNAQRTIEAPIIDTGRLFRRFDVNTLFVDIEGAEHELFKPGVIPDEISKIFVEIHRPWLGSKKSASVCNDLYALGFRLTDGAGLTSFWIR